MVTITPYTRSIDMESFIQRHAADVIGSLSGFDRIRFRGTKRLLSVAGGMFNFLWQQQVLLKHFKAYVTSVTERIRQATLRVAAEAGLTVQYITSPAASKEDIARRIAAERQVREGPICILSCVECCRSYEIRRNRENQELELHNVPSKCLHYYHYFLDPTLGFMHVRFQTWFPLTMYVCINGREWLARQMDAAGLGYVRRRNCFVSLQDVVAAQRLMDQQLRTDWPTLLNELAARVNPVEPEIFGAHPVPYYWSGEETEWASDIMFKSAERLAALYPRLIQHAMKNLGCADAMRYLGRIVPAHNGKYGTFKGEVVTDLRERPEGMRVKHRVNRNAVKMYDKEASVLRVETTINDPRDMKVYRTKEGDKNGSRAWRPLRKGVADMHRRAQISQASNDRYLTALATVDDTAALGELAEGLCQPVVWNGKRVRALNPLAEDDARLLETVNRGEFRLNGFRNRDLRPLLYGDKEVTPAERQRQSSCVSRKLRMLRAHGLIQKVSKTHRYVLTTKGTQAINALTAARAANTATLIKAA
jgi:hypothetical protein